ncbi:hypothetical protein ACFQDG_02755 [Natronoarchaeum mannanilyticum]|uniref:Uncharacterized protein n=1 Tax=Natronoarchaeum mannanilyticum TaxID=926360 RepID=A0AAV3TBE7_9EURY
MDGERVPDSFASHVLVVSESVDTNDEIGVHNDVLSAILDRSDTIDLWADADLVGDEYPDVAASLREAFERIEKGRYRGALPDCRSALDALLATEGVYRFVGLERLDARVDDQLLARYVPDHSKFRIDATAAEGLDAELRRTLADAEAGILPARTLAEWSSDGIQYELRPPSLCTDRSCWGLTGVTAVRLDDADRRIELNWAEPSGVLQRAADLLFPDSPRAFAFDDEAAYRDAADAFELIAKRLEIPVERASA